jgi:hypothetical protein
VDSSPQADAVLPGSPPSDAGGLAPQGDKRRKLRWKPIVGAIVALAIGWQVFQVLGKGDAGAASQPSASSTSSTSTSPTRVKIGDRTVLGAGAPIILLNPGLVAPGGQVTVQGGRFTPGATVDVEVRTKANTRGTKVAMSTVAKDGSLTAVLTAPQSLNASAVTVVAQERDSDKSAEAELMSQGGAATVALAGKATGGKPGDTVSINATGFGPGETLDVFWGRSTGTPSSTLTADQSGSLSRASVKVGMAPVGSTTLVLVGTKTHATAIAPFQMLGLYPTTTPKPYAVQSGKDMTYSGTGFAPDEQVLVYFNASGGTPALTVQASSTGDFSTTFQVPFGLTGSQSLTAIGAQSRAATSTAFSVLPYSPIVQASTYGALPGTSISFYAGGFAANEVVEVYLGRGQGASGELVTAFRVDAKGSAAAAGQYIIPSDSGPALNFTLVGQQSGGSGVAKVGVTKPPQPVNVPPQAPYELPESLGGKPSASSDSGSSPEGATPSPSPSSDSAPPASPAATTPTN